MAAEKTEISDDRFALAFYGAEPNAENAERFFNFIVRWFTDLGFPPERLGVTGAGYGKKKGVFSRGLKRVEKLGFSDAEHFELDALKPNDVSGALHLVAACLSWDAAHRFVVVSIPSSIATRDVWLPAARDMIECLRPAYGIAYERPLLKGPVFYAMGVNMSRLGDKIPIGDEYEQRRSISFWNDGMGKEVYREGLLRYVYRWNFLTRAQLDRDAEGVPLAQWIQADPRRGTLGHFAEDVSLWEVGEPELASIRERLHDAGVVFDWRKYFNIEPNIKTVLG